MRRLCAVLLVPLSCPLLHAQSVISVRSGLINYSEGAVFADNQPVVNKLGRYASLKDGSDLMTQDGRVEVLLTPNAYLRIGQNSGVRLISGDLSATKVALLNGSAILDSGNALAGDPITLVVRNAEIKVEEPSRLRIDADPPQLKVFKGKAEVLRDSGPLRVQADQIYPLDGSSVVQRMAGGADDMLDIWSQQRNRLIYFNLSSAQSIGDPQNDPGLSDTGPLYADGSGVYAGGISGWPGYVPMATIPPMGNLYFNPLLGYSYYGLYMPYPLGFYGLYGARSSFGYGSRGFSSGYRFSPVSPSGIYGYRGIATRPVSPGFSRATPAAPRPVMPARPIVPRSSVAPSRMAAPQMAAPRIAVPHR
jgi:hypothetical protein